MSNFWQSSKLKVLMEVVSMIALALGVVVGFLAWTEYRNSNKVNAESMLLNMDRQIYQKVAEKPNLQALFARMPINTDAIIGSQQLLKLFLRKKEHLSFRWKDIPDLHDKLYQYEGFNAPDRVKLREGLLLAEDILYILVNSYMAYSSSMESKTDFETWIAYVYDIGQHPLFLTAIYGGHKYGYMDPEFAAYLIKRMRESKDIEAILKAVYPDMLKEDWPSRTGKGWVQKNEMTERGHR